MFYCESTGRNTLREWLLELLPQMRASNPDASLLDEISATEILDLAYLQATPFDTATAAHVMYPEYVERSERMPVPSAMSVTFPVAVEAVVSSLTLEVELRCGRASELKIGQGSTMRVTSPRHPIPAVLLNPRIGGTAYELQEPAGHRCRSLAGPMLTFHRTLSFALTGPEGRTQERLSSPGTSLLFGYDDGGLVRLLRREQCLVGRAETEERLTQLRTYLWSEAHEAIVDVDVRWRRLSPVLVEVAVHVRNVTVEPPDREANDALLDALILPHLRLRVDGGRPDFPPLQYADAKRYFLSLQSEQERQQASALRLYSVRQSGGIATRSTQSPEYIIVTTFGIFDTPREIPVPGAKVAALTSDLQSMLSEIGNPSDALRAWLTVNFCRVAAIIRAAADAFALKHLHRFQWDAIAANLEFVAGSHLDRVTVVRAPTGAGKTIVFFINAAVSSLCSAERSTSIIMFPTRLLNEDMFRRLIAFVAKLRVNLPRENVTGGILMGTSDPLYKVLLEPEPHEPMYHYGPCPECGGTLVADSVNGRCVPKCTACHHRVDYMFNPLQVLSVIPDLVIATPDKLLYEATANSWDSYGLPFFGAAAHRCDECGRVCASVCIALKPSWRRCSEFYKNTSCDGSFKEPGVSKLIRYMGFDEVHSLYGETATYLSMFLANLESLQAVLSRRRETKIRYETATATIANESTLLSAVTRRSQSDIVPIPPQDRMHEYFEIVPERVRHRVLMTFPTKVSSRDAFIRTMLNSVAHLRSGDLLGQLAAHGSSPTVWRFLLGYLFKKQEGSDIRRALRDMYRNAFNVDLTVEFLSGEAPKDQISRIVQDTLAGRIDVLLANLVISLGVDIHDLNHMIMLGVPRGFTEYVQTAGRTGRGSSPGHVHVVLQPFYPRDAYLYRHFHAILSDVAGYYDVLPVKSTNLFCASEMFGNVAKSLLSALCMNSNPPQWPNARGIRTIMATMEGRIQSGITRILCDDPALNDDVRAMVDMRLARLLDEVYRANEFLSTAIKESDTDWLIYSLRGNDTTVKVRCMDQLLVERLASPGGTAIEQGEESPQNAQ